ncbi:membrane protein [Corynebacterium atypicum]|uniref:Membrane protein n=1 Tax=Corynebacterium atypicum TaxID=191610 RepID=A0ABM5QM03_9CORY|nr:DUF3239 domain-containing protein [Corynebacterium atypicum]AIG63831.1 membrane protein [Corynebacterium atypicum]
MNQHTFSFDVDSAWARAHNELLRDTRRLRSSAIVMAVIAVLIGIVAFLLIEPGSIWRIAIPVVSATFAVTSTAVGVAAKHSVGSAQDLYDKYPLVPAVIAEVNPRTVELLALVNTTVDPDQPEKLALAVRPISRIEGHPRKKGVQVPAVAVSGRRSARSQETWDEITPMPIAWATPDEDIIDKARKAIPQETWKRLNRAIDRVDEVKRTKFNLLPLD